MKKDVDGTVTSYIYDMEDIRFETDGVGAITAEYTHGSGIDEPLAMRRAGQNYYYHVNGLGSVTALTDSTKIVVQSYVYDSFGQIISQTGSIQNPYTYTGREYDEETGMYYYRARYYDANMGRFINEDPIGFLGGDVNLYAYVGNNPVNWIDPLGLCTSGVYYVSGVEYGGFLFFVGVKSAHLKFTCIGDAKDTFTATFTSLSIGGGLGGGVGTPAGAVKGCNKEEAISNFTGFGGSVTIYPGPFGLPSRPGFGSSAFWSSNFKAGGITPGYGMEVSGGGSYTFKW